MSTPCTTPVAINSIYAHYLVKSRYPKFVIILESTGFGFRGGLVPAFSAVVDGAFIFALDPGSTGCDVPLDPPPRSTWLWTCL